ncbi:MAG: restriction endonuclease subunit S [Nitrospiraceae bacterium]
MYIGLEHLAQGFPTLVGRGKESDIRSGKTQFRRGDVLFGKLRPYLRKAALLSEDGICSTDILVFRAADTCIPEYLCLLTHTDEFVSHARATTSGVQHPRTSWAALKEFKLHIPPISEQRKIASVLGLVQRAIEQQGRLIALTTELKKSLMQKLFTQSLVVLTEGGDFDKLGRGFIWNGEIEECAHQNHIFAVRVDRSLLLPEFFAHLSQSPYGKAYFLSVAHKTTNLACINTTKLKGFPVLIPSLAEQEEIVQMLGVVTAKLAQHVRKKQSLSDLFRTLLHQLMTAQIRVHDLDLAFLGKEANAG